MLWYVIQTYTGKEEKLVEMIRRVVPKRLYGECFVTYHEQLRHRQQENQIHIERVFPGYVFITSEEPEQLFFCLKNVPAMSKLISDGDYVFLPVAAEETAMLQQVLDRDHVIRLSYVETDGKDHIIYVSGPLRSCLSRVEGYQFRKRFAAIRLTLAGEEKHIRLGIILRDDVCRELAYGKVEAPIRVPERYRIPETEADDAGSASEADMEGRCGASETEAGNSDDVLELKVRNSENVLDSKVNDSNSISKSKVRGSGNVPGSKARGSGNALGSKARGSGDVPGSKARGSDNISGSKVKDSENIPKFAPGDKVVIVSGVFTGMPAMVYQIRKHEVKIGVHFFGRDTTMEVPIESVRKTVA